MPHFGMMLGNGFTIDLGEKIGINPSEPLSFFKGNSQFFHQFMKNTPAIEKELLHIANTEKNDYIAIEKFMKSPFYTKEKDYQLRRFLAFSYSALQMQLEHYNIATWKWTHWLRKNKDGIQFAISFNYDLLFENALQMANIPFFRTGSSDKKVGIPISKPHGSIDFDVLPSGLLTWHYAPARSHWNHNHVYTIPKQSWLHPRYEADIIPPHKENDQRVFQWVKEGIQAFLDYVYRLDHFVIIGLSYNEADRQEVNQYLEHLRPRTKVYVIDPKPNEQLLEKIRSLGLHLEINKETGLPW
ncbi:SIR2 family protein [Evansella tamaricis]|uniref:SIR2 family protein n=1 Tax=Evansella tamaricis TaxID=2069301 RepID=A0ABS6JJ33_9BACI|nr:SIR2 family protein [Evansella tamaricis]MBU9713214.1 SIR2 family protein [Evansella tamaricis]